MFSGYNLNIIIVVATVTATIIVIVIVIIKVVNFKLTLKFSDQLMAVILISIVLMDQYLTTI